MSSTSDSDSIIAPSSFTNRVLDSESESPENSDSESSASEDDSDVSEIPVHRRHCSEVDFFLIIFNCSS